MSIHIQISSGRGPAECGRAVHLAFRRMHQELQAAGFQPRLLEAEPGREPQTFHSILFSVEEPEAHALLSRWCGVIQWICPSPFRPSHGRKNWFISIGTSEPPATLAFRDSELRFETMRASGPGGQHVNKTESAVRVIHLPTGLVAAASEERSQHANRKLALARLSRQVEARNAAQLRTHQQERWQNHNELQRGNPARIFRGPEFQDVNVQGGFQELGG